MSVPQTHPRRRPLYNKTPPPQLSTSSSSSPPSSDQSDPTCRRSTPHHSVKLRKGATFHSPTTPPSEGADPILNIPSLPRRSPTCPRLLEDAIAAGENRMAVFLDKFDRNLSGLGGDSSKPSLRDDDPLPVPRGILDAHIIHADPMDTDADSKISKHTRDSAMESPHRHASDSGLGTSISGSMSAPINPREPASRDSMRYRRERNSSNYMNQTQTAITRSISSTNDFTTSQIPALGVSARKHIDRYILVPILSEKNLSHFHPLVRGVPDRIESKEIRCLRDLEKTLLFLAPVSQVQSLNVEDYAYTMHDYVKNYAPSKAFYIGFCEFTIQCLHTTVGFLNERDQRRPTDRPYTNGYFLDLVEQIRRYATMVNAARERQGTRPRSSLGENNMEYSSDEELTLEGGLGSTGRPAEFVRKKKDKAISLRTGEPYEEKASPVPMMKRSLSMESCDDSVARSMARRKKNEPPLNINKKCDHCDKVFKRPCDLTKHEKTHTRPWKCDEVSCKYHEYGWPTEKERDRHVNDKHSKSPELFKCYWPDCSYQSKRQSNCKQHMEKAHGWQYVRSKNNGKNGSRATSSNTPRTPNIKTPNSGTLDNFTPQTQPAPSPHLPDLSPCVQSLQYSNSETSPVDSLMAPPEQDFPLFSDPTINQFDGLDFSTFDPPLDFSAFQSALEASDPNEYVPSLDTHVPSVDSSATTPNEPMGSAFLDEAPLDPSHANDGFDMDFFTSRNDEYTTLNMHQLLTPDMSVGDNSGQKIPSLSPAGQGNVMLYSPNSQHIDEGFHDVYDPAGKPNADFTLFDTPMNDAAAKHQIMENAGHYEQGQANNFPVLDAFAEGYNNATWPNELNPIDLHTDDYMMDNGY
ncbi:hypothetical protein AJ79_05642 [Helicocarpus griseus UAMH5409]|uniref:C2H2-type domain-containing protein n=1 Tax=Helicocarpus griseus UAMH5409 TaxID=1447875 RepID=A0A2B7XKJ1_9EURO|nr:hypothetical protein AJ79_05642 [Helicocarpus griseus UAMH5409]